MILSWLALMLGILAGLIFGYRLWRVRGEGQGTMRTRLDALALVLCVIGTACGIAGLMIAT